MDRRWTRRSAMLVSGMGCMLLLGVACSSSNNNHNATATSAAPAVSATRSALAVSPPVATAAAPSASVPPPPSPPPVPLRTTTPAVRATGSPASGSLQQQLNAAVLQTSDLPGGYALVAGPDTTTPIPNEVAANQQIFGRFALPNVSLIIDAVQAYPDTGTAHTAVQSVPTSLQAANQALGLSLSPASSTMQLGEDTQVYKVSLSYQGVDLNGYLIAWRHGRLVATVALAGEGSAVPNGPEAVTPLAQKQDARLQMVTP